VLTVVHSLPIWLPLTATWLYNQIRYLPAEISSHIVCGTADNLDQFNIQNLYCLENVPQWRYLLDKCLRKRSAKRYLAYLSRVAKSCRATILHSHWGEAAWRDVPVAEELGLLHIVSFYGKDVNYYPRQHPKGFEHYRMLFGHVDLVLCEGSHMAQCIVNLGCSEQKVRVQHLGGEVDRIPFQPRVWNGKEPLRVLLAASFREKKGIPFALEALGMLQEELLGLEITIIGDASNDPRSHSEKARILAVLEKYKLCDRTRLLGYQPYAVLFEEAYKHHIFVSPSLTASDGDTEGGAPVTLIEMAATGMPIVSTTHCDIPSIVIHGRTGLLAEERDLSALLDHLRWLVAHPEGWHEMVEAGRRHIETTYNVVKQSNGLGETYLSAGCDTLRSSRDNVT